MALKCKMTSKHFSIIVFNEHKQRIKPNWKSLFHFSHFQGQKLHLVNYIKNICVKHECTRWNVFEIFDPKCNREFAVCNINPLSPKGPLLKFFLPHKTRIIFWCHKTNTIFCRFLAIEAMHDFNWYYIYIGMTLSYLIFYTVQQGIF